VVGRKGALLHRGPGDVRYRDRWFCYLDLLGFALLVNSDKVHEVIPTYEDVIQELKSHADAETSRGVMFSWFSDTFIVYSRYGTERDFAAVESVGCLFFQRLLLADIPVRGALTYGKLYSRGRKNIFVGPALIDAYSYGEKQNWLGFLLTPNASERLRGTRLDLRDRAHYRSVDQPEVLRGLPHEGAYA
jgi:hypothetical protein